MLKKGMMLYQRELQDRGQRLTLFFQARKEKESWHQVYMRALGMQSRHYTAFASIRTLRVHSAGVKGVRIDTDINESRLKAD